MNSLTCIDLFSGCGGFSLGMERAGFHTLAAIDVDPQAIQTYRKNFVNVPHVLQRDLTEYDPSELDVLLGGARVDVITGGPPCQGFSNVRKVDGANHGNRFVEDPRRYLYRDFLKFVSYFHPRVFVIENVLGIRTTAGGEFYTRVNSEARALGYRVHGEEIRAWQYGVPQKRIRQLIIGTKNELPIFVGSRFIAPTHSDSSNGGKGQLAPIVTLWEAIGDLLPLQAGTGAQSCQYDLSLRKSQIARYSDRYIKSVLEVHKAKTLTAHVARPHNDRDLRDFDRLREGESSAVAMRDRNVIFEWPYSKEHFRDRYTRQHRDHPCSTIVAHLSKDGLMFIHPTQCRSLTAREAARVQTFPDWFLFPQARTHAFRLIGNAVPPVIGQAVGSGIRAYLQFSRHRKKQINTAVPTSPLEAFHNLGFLMKVSDNRSLRKISIEDFKRGWFSVGFLYPNLHPDGVTENGAIVVDEVSSRCDVQSLRELSNSTFARSGWPVKLISVGKEARRRFLRGQLSYDDYYYSHAQKAGIEHLEERVVELNASAARRA